MDNRESLKSKYPEICTAGVTNEYQVHWGDMDAARHVNNLVYLRWCESGRISYFKAIGINTSFAEGIGPILGWMDAKYIRPITFPDRILVTTSAIEMRSDRLICEGKVYSEKLGKLAFISKQEIIPYDYLNLRKASIPSEWVSGIKNLETEADL